MHGCNSDLRQWKLQERKSYPQLKGKPHQPRRFPSGEENGGQAKDIFCQSHNVELGIKMMLACSPGYGS